MYLVDVSLLYTDVSISYVVVCIHGHQKLRVMLTFTCTQYQAN